MPHGGLRCRHRPVPLLAGRGPPAAKDKTMEFDNAFEVPLPPDEAWRLLLDIERIAPCMPGAELTEVVDERTYKGRTHVRLGPVALSFGGVVKFEDIDAAARACRVTAQGTDSKGRGGANAVVGFRVEPSAGGSTVRVHTNLTLTGTVAQYGRSIGIVQATAGQLIKQFAEALRTELATSPPLAPADESAVLPQAGEQVARDAPLAPAQSAATRPAPAAPPRPAAKPISGFALAMAVIRAWIGRLFGRS